MPIDYSKYPPNWKTEIVPTILKRAGNKCECCELSNKATVYAANFCIKDDEGRYRQRSIWFSSKQDAIREKGNAELIREVKAVLTVAHLDHDELNHDVSLDRLKAMCQVCHLRYDAKEKYRRMLVKGEQVREARLQGHLKQGE